MRCPDCNKFVSYDEPNVEEENIDIFDNVIQGSIRVSLICSECGTELKENIFEIEEIFEHECKLQDTNVDNNKENSEEEGFEIVDSYFDSVDRYKTEDKNGKPIKNARYMKHFYGFEGKITIKCLKCKQEFNVDVFDENQASYFDECC